MLKKNNIIVNGSEGLLSDLSKIAEENSVTIYVNKFNEESAKKFYEEFNKALTTSQTVIPIIIDSYGGYVDSLIYMMDVISESPIPVATVCLGKAMSCGSILLTCGTKGLRFMAPSSRVMVHHVSSFSWGKEPEMQVDVKETKRLQEVVFHRMAKNCGKKNKNFFLEELKKRGNADWFLDAKECKKLGIIDNVKVPTFSTNLVIQNIIT